MNAKANNTIDKVRELQRGLYQCAKNNRQRRFHALYDKVHRMDVLWKAWDIVRKNKGAGGVDEMTIGEIEDTGVEAFLLEIKETLEGGDYRPRPVKRTYIPKKDGKKRPLGLPTVKDKVVQTAAKIVMEPIFEADFRDCSFGFRPKRNQHQALEVIRKKCNNKGWWVLDADIKGYFDNIDHEKLLKLVEKRICDRRMTKLIRLWLKAGVMEDGHVIETETGSAQGASISPLLSNIYLNVLDCYWEKNYSHLGILVRFADDFVIIAKTKKDIGHAYKAVAYVMAKPDGDQKRQTLHDDGTGAVEESDEGKDQRGVPVKEQPAPRSAGGRQNPEPQDCGTQELLRPETCEEGTKYPRLVRHETSHPLV